MNGPRARFLVDIMNPCWIWPAADLAGVNRIEAAVGQLPFNFQIGDDIKKVVLHPPTAAAGELEVRQDRCDGAVIASLPLAPALKSQAVTRLNAPLAATAPGPHDRAYVHPGESTRCGDRSRHRRPASGPPCR